VLGDKKTHSVFASLEAEPFRGFFLIMNGPQDATISSIGADRKLAGIKA